MQGFERGITPDGLIHGNTFLVTPLELEVWSLE
jgi:hypothetical protein